MNDSPEDLHGTSRAADTLAAMRSFCIVVQRGHEDLYDALRQAFQARPGFYVVLDRRARNGSTPRSRRPRERRTSTDEWGTAHFLIAESLDPFGNG